MFAYLESGQGSLLNWIELNFINTQVFQKIFLGTFFCGPMWFLYAQIWTYILLLIWTAKFRVERLYSFAPILLSLHIIARTIVRMLDVSWYSASYFRSSILYALPFMLLGMMIVAKKGQLNQAFSDRVLLLMGIIGCFEQFVEYAIFRESLDFYFGTIFFALAIFLFCIKHPDLGKGIFSFMGKELSMVIYIIHMMVISLTLNILSYIGNETVIEWSAPVHSIAFSVFIAVVYWGLRKNVIKATKK